MRKELLVFISTAEQGEELSVLSVAKNRDFVLLTSSIGKFTANRKELLDALTAIGEFDTSNNSSSETKSLAPNFEEVSYGETEG
jgi:hypothetical protein